MCFFLLFLHAQQNDVKSGALIVAKLEGKIQFLDGQGNPVEEGKIKDGDTLPKDYSAITGDAPSKIIFL